MRTIEKAHRIIAACPREALSDAVGVIAMVALIFGGFTLPAFL
ncbi:MAG: hypothetical protein AAGK00_02270 [Pseudomonadota bacterium]